MGNYNGVSDGWYDRDLWLAGRMIAQSYTNETYFLHADHLQSDTQVTVSLAVSYFNRTRKLFLSGMISILSSRASHPKPKLKSSPDPLALFFSWASVCGPRLESACQTFPAVSPTWLLMSIVCR